MTPKHKKEEIIATVLVYQNNEFMVDIPSAEYWTNNTEAKFVICFRNRIEKQHFLKIYRKRENFRIDLYVYSRCQMWNIHHTNMTRCQALRDYDDSHILEDIFNGKIPN